MSQVVFHHETDELHALDDRASALALELYTSQALEKPEAATRLRSSMLTASATSYSNCSQKQNKLVISETCCVAH